MNRVIASRVSLASLIVLAMLAITPAARAQDDAGPPPMTEAKIDTAGPGGGYGNNIAGEFTPARGFDLIKTVRGSLNISVYGLFRYVNQLPANQTFTDHLGRVRTVNTRNDLNWHRTLIWLTGFFYDTRFRYNITAWSLPTTQQTLVFGNLQYVVGKPLTLGVGLAPNLTNRSMTGSWPFWAGSDRQMTEESLRGGFSSGFWVTGQPIDRFYYNVSVNNNLSQLGVVAANDTRDVVSSASLWWMPTTGEFGPRGGFGDLEHHEHLATRFGVSGGMSHESRYAPLGSPPNATQIKLSDGINPFDDDALASGVTVTRLRYQESAFDAGAKLKGFSIQGEYMIRRLSQFEATGPLPIASNYDHGFYIEAMQMAVPKRLGIYGVTSYIYDEFQRHPWEVAGGASFYPFGTRSWRLNLHVIHIEKSPASSSFGYYTSGQTGTTFSLGTDILL